MQRGLWPHGGTAKKLATAYLFTQWGGWQKPEYQCGQCQAAKHHERRNCSKFFPEKASAKKHGWVPRFSIAGEKPKSFSMPDYVSPDCPVACVTGASMALVELIGTSSVVNENKGSLYGSNASKWPAAWVDALSVVAVVRRAHEKAFEKANK